MNRWLLGMVVGMFACAAGFLAVIRHLTPPPVERVLEETADAAPASPQILEPVILTQVVDTADIDSLLDPTEKPITGEPFDADEKPLQVETPGPMTGPNWIPPAIEYMPRPEPPLVYPPH